MNLNIFLSLIIFLETCLIIYFISRWRGRRLALEIAKKKFTFKLNPNPKFFTVKSDKFHVKQKTFIETAEIGVYLMRLYYVKAHRHLQTSSVLYILKGRAKVSLGKRSFLIKPGDFLYVPAGEIHHWQVLAPDKYVDYLEFNNPSFAQTNFEDTIWS